MFAAKVVFTIELRGVKNRSLFKVVSKKKAHDKKEKDTIARVSEFDYGIEDD